MRTSSFSHEHVIRMLSRYFIPVWSSSDNYDGTLGAADLAEWNRIQRGRIMIYLIAPDGTVFDRMNVTEALQTEKNLIPMLERAIKNRKLKPRDPAAVRASAVSQVRPPRRKDQNGLLFHVSTFGGHDPRRGEDYVELAPAEWSALVPPARARAGTSWRVPKKVADRLYRYCYPAVCNYWADHSKVRAGSLTATVVASKGKQVRIALRGVLALEHDVTDNGTFPARVSAELIGLATYDRQKRTLTRFQLAAERATYRKAWQGKATEGAMAIAVELVR
jgi:hypothetical protein